MTVATPSAPPAAIARTQPAGPLRGIGEGIALGVDRLRRRALVVGGGGVFFTLFLAIVERQVGAAAAVDRTLQITFSWFLPLMCVAMVSAAIGPRALRDATWPVARFGVSRQAVATGLVIAISVACIVPAVLMAAFAVLVAHNDGGIPIARDLVTSSWIAALTAWAYAGWFSLGSAFGKQGGGRTFVLALDFVLGSVGAFAVVFPRGNAMNLLGFETLDGASQHLSSVLLPAIAVVMTGLSALRCRD
jgi:hypothetical protein